MRVQVVRDSTHERNLWFASDEREIQFRPRSDHRGYHIAALDMDTVRATFRIAELPWSVFMARMEQVAQTELPEELVDFVIESCKIQRSARLAVFDFVGHANHRLILAARIIEANQRLSALAGGENPTFEAYCAREAEYAQLLFSTLARITAH